MLQRLTAAKNPLFEEGNQIEVLTTKGNINNGFSRGEVLFTSFDEDLECNICFIKLFAKQDVFGNWLAYEKPVQVFREEKSIKKLK